MSIALCCGAECSVGTFIYNGNTDQERHWRWVSGAPTISTSVFRSGGRSWALAAAATTPQLEHTAVVSQSVWYFRGYLRVTTATPASTVTVAAFLKNLATPPTLTITTGGVLQYDIGGGAATGPTLVADTWYGVELEVDCSANPHTGRWRTWDAVGGWITRTAPTNLAQAATTLDTAHIRCAGVTSGFTVYWDDILIGESTAAGTDYATADSKGGKVLRYLPNADGTHSFTAGDFGYDAAGADVATSATDVWQKVDDDDQTSVADFIRQKVIRNTGYVELQFADEATETNPRCVAITSRHHSSDIGANTMSIKVSDDSFVSTTAVWTDNDISNSSGVEDRHKVLATKPSGGAWTQAAVNALRARWGYSTDVTDIPYLDSISLEVEWTEVIATNAPAGHAAATGAAYSPAVGNAVHAAVASATGWASASLGSDANVAAELVSATAAVGATLANVGPVASTAAATGAAYDAYPMLGAGVAAATGEAYAAVGTIAPVVGVAEATGTAYDITAGITTDSALASPQATAQAFDATAVTIDGSARAEHIAITAAAGTAIAALGVNAEHLPLTGAAYDATATVTATNAGAATATGAAYGPLPAVGPSPEHIAATGAAHGATGALLVNAEHVAATGQAYGVALAMAVNAGVASGTASAHNAGTSAVVNAEHASATGAAYNPDMVAGTVHAEAATATGAAYAPIATFSINAEAALAIAQAYGLAGSGVGVAEVASATGAAYIAGPSVSVNAGLAEAFADAWTPAASIAAYANAATGTGEAGPVYVSVAPGVGVAAATGSVPGGAPSIAVMAGVAAATGAAYIAVQTGEKVSGGTAPRIVAATVNPSRIRGSRTTATTRIRGARTAPAKVTSIR